MRMAPYTKVLPKGLLPVGEQPILEILVKQLCTAGFTSITMACGYLAPLIQTYFRDGSQLGVSIDYFVEEVPLGTAGALKYLKRFDSPFLVLNCDVLTTLDFRRLYEFHCCGDGVLTVASQKQNIPIHLGVLEVSADKVTSLLEKPAQSLHVSMGMYVMDPMVVDYMPDNQPLDTPQLIQKLIANSLSVRHYQNDSYWLDIGRPDDYTKANQDYPSMASLLLPSEVK